MSLRLWLFVFAVGHCSIYAQSDVTFHSNVPLVIAPTIITDRHGRIVERLTERDLVLYDDNVAQRVQVEDPSMPISLVLVLQSSAEPLLGKVRTLGGLVEPLITGDRGEAALITFHEDVHIEQTFTTDVQVIAKALTELKASGDGSSSIDAMVVAAGLLRNCPPNRRRVVVLIGEGRDRTSKKALGEAVFLVQKENITVYSITFSRWLLPFTPKGDPPAI